MEGGMVSMFCFTGEEEIMLRKFTSATESSEERFLTWVDELIEMMN